MFHFTYGRGVELVQLWWQIGGILEEIMLTNLQKKFSIHNDNYCINFIMFS